MTNLQRNLTSILAGISDQICILFKNAFSHFLPELATLQSNLCTENSNATSSLSNDLLLIDIPSRKTAIFWELMLECLMREV